MTGAHAGDDELRQLAERCRHLFMNVDAIVWEMDAPTWRFTFVSEAAERILGYPVADWLEQPGFWAGIIHPDDRAATVARCRKASAECRDHDFEYRVISADGRTVWLHDKVRALRGEDGACTLQGVMLDITEKKATAAALERREEQFRQLAESIDGVFWLFDTAQHRTIYVSPAYERIYGRPAAALATNFAAWLDAVHPDDRERAGRLAVHGYTEPYDEEYRIIRPDGEVRWIHDRGYPVHDVEGRVTRIAGVAQDVTEHRRLVDRLRESEEQFRQITDHVRELFWIFSADFSRTIYMSPAYERLWGGSLAEIYRDAHSFLEIVHPEDRALLQEAMADIGGSPVQDLEYRIVRPDGSVRWMLSQGAPVRDGNGVVYRVVGTTEDITERKALEAERAAAERHYRRLVQNAPYAVYVLDAQARFRELNPAAAQLVGRPAEQMIGRSIAEIMHPDDVPKALQSIREKATGDVSVSDIELRMIHASGAERLARIRATAIIEDGRYVGTHGIAADITEERAREEEARLLAAALQNLDEGVAICRPEGQLLFVNSRYAELLGFDAAQRPLPNVRDFAAPEQVDAVVAAMRIAFEEGSWSGRISYRPRHDRSVPLEVILGRVEAAGETLLFILMRDVSHDIQREEHLRRAERLASVGTLIGGVAHELNNPLNAITSFATLLLETPRSAEEREDIATIHREAMRAAKIVADLRLLARRTQDEPNAHVQVDLNDVVTHVLRTRRYAHATGNISTTLDLAEELPAVWADPGQLEQVVINLVVNAEQALEGAVGERRVIVRTRASGGGVSLHVIDSGIGIPAAYLDRIFDPFFTTKATGEGTGLGLSLVHSIVEEHGGDVRVESKEGRGTAFHLEFPAVRRTLRAAEASTVTPQPRRALRILLVDDEAPLRRALSRYLTRRGHRVTEAGDGAEALRLIAMAEAGAAFDVILSDLRMPGLSGDRMLERLRELGTGEHRRVLFLTGDAASGHAARILAETQAPVIFKPVELAELARRIEEYADRP